LLDPLAVSLAVAIIGLNGFVQIIKTYDPFFANVIIYFAPITHFVSFGAIRVIIKFANFNWWQNIGFKLMFFADSICYFVIGFYIMYSDKKVTDGANP